jgi:glycosyltransferase involved in cell wall biosynthesis
LLKSGIIGVNSAILREVANKLQKPIESIDEVTFVRRNYSRFWVVWALWRAWWNERLTAGQIVRMYSRTRSVAHQPVGKFHRQPGLATDRISISVVIITLKRYPYLIRTVEQLLRQDYQPIEIIVVDGTPIPDRGESWLRQLAPGSIPIVLINSDIVGQCTQRNTGIAAAKGDYIYFCDDDMEEIRPDHISRHVQNLLGLRADASCGQPDEIGCTLLNRERLALRVSDVFPTNDVVVSKQTLIRAGLFDTKLDKGQNEDHDLGIRIWLKGGLSVIDPGIRALHLRAGSGGLRQRGARKVTRASSRAKLVHFRNLTSSEFYIAFKYFPFDRVQEYRWINSIATFRFAGNFVSRGLRTLVAMAMLPMNLSITRHNSLNGKRLLYA